MDKFTFRYFPNPVSKETEQLEKKIFLFSMIIPTIFLIIIWLIKIIETTLNVNFTNLGMYPRHIEGITGILTSPLIHGDFQHLIGNSSSFFILSTALFFFYREMAYRIFVLNYILAGLFLWLGGRSVWHIGASGVIYGLAAFLFFSGLFRKDLRLLTISMLVIFIYGSLFWGIFPIKEGISWDGHLMGAVSGTILSLIFYKYGPPRRQFEWELENDDDDDQDYTTIENDESQDPQTS